jgi:hypothetical protein
MKTKYVALAVAAALGLGSVPAFAQSRHHDGGRGAWQHQRADRGNWGHHRYVAPRYYGHGYNYRRNDDGDLFGALAIGAIAGALVGSASNNYYAAPPVTYYTPPTTYYTPPTTYYTPPTTYYTPPATYYNPGYGGYYYGN